MRKPTKGEIEATLLIAVIAVGWIVMFRGWISGG